MTAAADPSRRIDIERLAIRLKGVSEREARALARELGPALEARLARLDPGAGSGRIGSLDAGRVPASGGAGRVAEAVGRALSARLGRGGGES